LEYHLLLLGLVAIILVAECDVALSDVQETNKIKRGSSWKRKAAFFNNATTVKNIPPRAEGKSQKNIIPFPEERLNRVKAGRLARLRPSKDFFVSRR
jgi:hypothetical protein